MYVDDSFIASRSQTSKRLYSFLKGSGWCFARENLSENPDILKKHCSHIPVRQHVFHHDVCEKLIQQSIEFGHKEPVIYSVLMLFLRQLMGR